MLTHMKAVLAWSCITDVYKRNRVNVLNSRHTQNYGGNNTLLRGSRRQLTESNQHPHHATAKIDWGYDGRLKSYQRTFHSEIPVLSSVFHCFAYSVCYFSAKAPGNIFESLAQYSVLFIWRVYLHIYIFAHLTCPRHDGDDIVLFHKEQSYIDAPKMRLAAVTCHFLIGTARRIKECAKYLLISLHFQSPAALFQHCKNIFYK